MAHRTHRRQHKKRVRELERLRLKSKPVWAMWIGEKRIPLRNVTAIEVSPSDAPRHLGQYACEFSIKLNGNVFCGAFQKIVDASDIAIASFALRKAFEESV